MTLTFTLSFTWSRTFMTSLISGYCVCRSLNACCPAKSAVADKHFFRVLPIFERRGMFRKWCRIRIFTPYPKRFMFQFLSYRLPISNLQGWKLSFIIYLVIRIQICYISKTKQKEITFYIVKDIMISFLLWHQNVISQSTISVSPWCSLQYNFFVIITHVLQSRKTVLENRFFIWKSFNWIESWRPMHSTFFVHNVIETLTTKNSKGIIKMIFQ